MIADKRMSVIDERFVYYKLTMTIILGFIYLCIVQDNSIFYEENSLFCLALS